MRISYSRSLLILFLVCFSCLANGQADTEKKPAAEKRPPPAVVDERTGLIMNKAIELLNSDQFTEARDELSRLNMGRLSPYEKSRIEQILSSIDYSQDNFAGARGHLQLALDSGGLNSLEKSQVLYQIAQMYLAEELWQEGANAMQTWIDGEASPTPTAFYLLAVAYYQLGEFPQALLAAYKAIELNPEPPESHLQMLSSLLLSTEKYAEAATVLERLIVLVPEKKIYWQQLSSTYSQLEEHAKALAILELAFHNGLITEDTEIRRIADLMIFQNVPYRAAVLLDSSIRNKQVNADQAMYEKLANAWIASREFARALPVLEQAGNLSEDGRNYFRLAEVNFQLEDWEAATAALQKAIDKGGLRDPGSANLLMGIALYNLKNFESAKEWLKRATESPAQARTATGFLQLISSNEV